jgi:alkanesulfonate monooxygenase SsuD/methylene tetrahydromethanopterin reductase-like flavin-dependent oxidoreductase (luciferase family)
VRVGYLIDTNVLGGGSLDDIIEEGILAERAGFHGVFAPDRHGRPECAFPGAEQLLTVRRARRRGCCSGASRSSRRSCTR